MPIYAYKCGACGHAKDVLQKISDDPRTTTRLVEFEGVSPIANKVFLRAKAGYSESAGFNGPNYRYEYFQADLIFPF